MRVQRRALDWRMARSDTDSSADLEAGPVRVAMWSGPRNLSTALMRSWGSRADTVVTDEPLYAVYLAGTGLDHPGRNDVLEAQPTDWPTATSRLAGPVPTGAGVWYQKHMAHHLLPTVGREWLDHGFRHAFLIRDPAAVLVSLDRVTPNPTLTDTGLLQQAELFARVADLEGEPPPVIDSADVLRDPEGTLRALCAALEVAWDPAMLSWAPGPRDTDGVWAPHWYRSVRASTGFGPPRPGPAAVPGRLQSVLKEAQPLYDTLSHHRLHAPAV
ncbi:MAG: hypothetical protein WBA11_20175 [Rubrivirga sp.]